MFTFPLMICLVHFQIYQCLVIIIYKINITIAKTDILANVTSYQSRQRNITDIHVRTGPTSTLYFFKGEGSLLKPQLGPLTSSLMQGS